MKKSTLEKIMREEAPKVLGAFVTTQIKVKNGHITVDKMVVPVSLN